LLLAPGEFWPREEAMSTILAFTVVAVALAIPVLTPLMWRKIEKD